MWLQQDDQEKDRRRLEEGNHQGQVTLALIVHSMDFGLY